MVIVEHSFVLIWFKNAQNVTWIDTVYNVVVLQHSLGYCTLQCSVNVYDDCFDM